MCWDGFSGSRLLGPMRKPKHLLTSLTFRGQKVYLESTGDEYKDKALLDRWNRLMKEVIEDRNGKFS